MAEDWSQLPRDLLQLISEKLDCEFDKLRFRSVCSTWHSSVPKNNNHQNHLILFKCPIPSDNNNSTTTYPLSKRSLFLVIPPPNQQTLKPWLIKIGPDSRDRTHLWDPLSRHKQFPLHFPHVIDVTQHRFLNLGHEFVIGDFPSQPPPIDNSIYTRKVVVADTWHNGGKVLFTINNSGKLAIFRCGDEHWTIIHEDDRMRFIPCEYDDVIVFNGQLIAVDRIGRTVTVGPDLRVDLVAKPVFRGGASKNFLVESDGELLLAVQFVSNERIFKIPVRFDVFRLDEKKKKWVEVRNLGGRVLFLGEDSVFSASASDLCIHNGYSIPGIIPCTVFGNSVIFRDDILRNFPSTELGISVYHLDIDETSPFSDFPFYVKLVWPPPEWVGLRIDNNRVCVLD